MKRPTQNVLARAGALILSIVGACMTTIATEPDPPNVVLIISDDQHFGDLGFMGHPHIATPNLDRLARESMVWTHGRVTTSLCCPSLATIITGQYPRSHGVTGNTPSPSTMPAFGLTNDIYIERIEVAPTLPRLLSSRNYLSLQTGKWWHGSFRTGGFTHGMTHGDVTRGGRHGDVGLSIGRKGLEPIDRFIDRALDEDRPFMLWYAPFMPHTPHTPPERLRRSYLAHAPSEPIARYWAMCTWFDESVGELRALLDDKGVAETTALVFITDNGWINRPDASRYAPCSKRSPYDGGLRTPIMVHWPGHVEPGRSDALACSIDIAPTVLTLAGLEVPESMQGVDLLDDAALAQRRVLHGAVYSHDAVDARDPDANWEYRWCVKDGWKLLEPNQARFPERKIELYHVASDEDESDDRADDEPERVRAMLRFLADWWSASVGGN